MIPSSFYKIFIIGIILLILTQVLSPFKKQKLERSFQSWLTNYKSYAHQNLGISNALLSKAFKNTHYNQNIINIYNNQIEYKTNLSQYLNIVITKRVITRGKLFLKQNLHELNKVSKIYNIPPYIIASFLVIGNRYSKSKSNFNATSALSSLAFKKIRVNFFTSELSALLILMNKQYIHPGIKSTWAGALGTLKFMPSTYLYYATTSNKNYKNNINLLNNTSDQIFSIATYLKALGWSKSKRWGYRVSLPKNLNIGLINYKVMKSFYEWKSLQVKLYKKCIDYNKSFCHIKPYSNTRIYIDPKDSSQSYLVTSNFNRILKWNKSSYFAIAIGVLSDKLKLIYNRL